LKKHYLLALLLLTAFTGFIHPEAQAQNKKRVVQLSGVVTDTAGLLLPGVNIYVPKAGRGTSTLNNGWFSMPVLIGDSVVISSVGFKRAHYIVPEDAKEFQSILVELHPDKTFLDQVDVTPIATEELFKEAVLALNIPVDDTGIDKKQMNAELLALMVRSTPMDGNANYRYYIDQFANSPGDKYHPIYNPFLNPLNWVKFFKDIKKKKNGR
jgi:hypothetical protein